MSEIVGSNAKEDWTFNPNEDFLSSFCQDLETAGMTSCSAYKTFKAEAIFQESGDEQAELSTAQKEIWKAILANKLLCPFSVPGDYATLPEYDLNSSLNLY